MPILARPRTANSARPRFRTPPWHDDHPARLDLAQRLAPDHLARTIERAVARLDLTALRATYGRTGSEAHCPERLLGVVLYEMRRGRHGPADWHRDAQECEPVRWLLRGAVVSRSCWYAFRDRVAPLLLDLNAQVLAQALDAGLTTATRAAQDGTLVAANASRHKLVNQATLHKRVEQLAAACANDRPTAVPTAGVAAAACADDRPTAGPAAGVAAAVVPAARDGVTAGPTVVDGPAPPGAATAAAAALAAAPAWLAAAAAGRRQQQQRLERAQERLAELQGQNQQKWPSKRKAAEAIVVSLSDPEAVVGRDKEKVYRPLYNVQVVADLDSPLVLGYEVFAQQNDAGVLGGLLAQVRQQLGHGLKELLADTAYAGGADLAAAVQEGVTVYAPVPGDGVKNPKQIPKREFSWQAAEQTYVCPQGHRLVFEESWREKRVGGGVQVWRYRCPPEHCQACPLQARCTTAPAKGRAVTRQEHEELIEGLRSRMETAEAKALYRLRGQKVELVNADWKEHRKLRRFSGRGLWRVRGEVGLLVLAHNLVTLEAEETKLRARRAKAAAANPVTNTT
jgi:transposase